ncbi:MAG: hypothetical protein R2867_36480 [Caldilineaceae bacterium]
MNIGVQGTGEGGFVTVDPEQDVYFYGDTITLTAVANQGYLFTGWENIAGGAERTATIVSEDNPLRSPSPPLSTIRPILPKRRQSSLFRLSHGKGSPFPHPVKMQEVIADYLLHF